MYIIIILEIITMHMTYDEEYENLKDLIIFKGYRRYGDDLYTKYSFEDGYEWKFEYNICEFGWGFCKSPCFANELVKQLKKDIPNMNKCLKALAKGNNVKSDRMYTKWDTAMDAVELNDNSRKPLIIYSTENSHFWSDKKVFCNDVDGELWHGILMTQDSLDNLDHIGIELCGTNAEGYDWNIEYRWHQTDVLKASSSFDTELILFTPFKHPLILLNSGLELNVSFNFVDDRLPKETQIKMVYGICNSTLRNWIENPTSTFTTELAFGRKLIVDTSNYIVDEVSINVEK